MCIKELRIKKGVTQQCMADYLGITRGAYSNLETGRREPDIRTLIALADYFNVSIDYLLNRKRRYNMGQFHEDVIKDYYAYRRSGASAEQGLSYLEKNLDLNDCSDEAAAIVESLKQEIAAKNASSNNEIVSYQKDTLLKNFDLLNREGQEKLVGYSSDLVQTGKYKKMDQLDLAQEA